jgi:hypothetical protein
LSSPSPRRTASPSLEAPGDARERVAVDQARARAGKLALVDLREAFVERERDDAVQHRVADELEALVVARAVTAMRQRLREQVRRAEVVAQPPAERLRHAARVAPGG